MHCRGLISPSNLHPALRANWGNAVATIIFLVALFFTEVFSAYNPLGRDAYITSSFGESRGTRYHAGIDFSTDMEEGWAVIAPDDGTVEFAAKGAFGYGRYIKFRTKDKYVWLFAHLSEYNPKIDAAIRKEILKKQKPKVQLNLNIRFKKGDTLAYSGSSGIGNPHLHIERRTPDAKAVLNPCAKINCTDTIPPTILEAAPYTGGLAVKIVDYSREPLENPMSIYSLEIFQNKKKLFEKKYDSLTFTGMSKIKDDILRVEDSVSTVGDWHFVRIENGEFCPSFATNVENIQRGSRGDPRGRPLPEGFPKIEIIATDFAKNISKKEFILTGDTLKLNVEEKPETPYDSVAPSIGKAYIKQDFAGRQQCRIPINDSLSGFDFESTDFRDKNGKWVLFDFHLNSKELFVEQRDFNFKDKLKMKICGKLKVCREEEIKCESYSQSYPPSLR